MTSAFYRIMNFNASMLPLLVLLPLVRISEYISMEKDRYFNIALGLYLGLLAISIIFDLIFLYVTFSKKTESEKFTCKSVQKTKTFSFEYILTVILPLFVFDVTDVWSFIPLILTLSLIGFLYVKNDLCFYNILMDLLGYQLYNMTLMRNSNIPYDNSNTKMVYVKKNMRPSVNRKLDLLLIGTDMYLLKDILTDSERFN